MNATKVIFDSQYHGGYAFNTLVMLATDSEMDGVQIVNVIRGNLRGAEAEAIAKASYPGLAFDYSVDSNRPIVTV